MVKLLEKKGHVAPETHCVVAAGEPRILSILRHLNKRPCIGILNHFLEGFTYASHPPIRLGVKEALCLAISDNHLALLLARICRSIDSPARCDLAPQSRVKGRKEGSGSSGNNGVCSNLHI